ncbi:MAG TPA: hypothetical protein VLT47_00855 [Anaeromyxobacteraceae bacterium]|nr:hypothetical protein [Anaeromyxobacteraceae bacterium]
MTRGGVGGGRLLVALAGAAGGFALLELAGVADGRGALIVAVSLLASVAQGTVAAAAASDLTGARWIGSVRKDLLVGARLQPLLALLFLLLWPRLGLYPWAAEPGEWLNRPFFLARNVALLGAVALLARLYADRALRGDPATKPFAVAYLFAFFVSQTLVGFDWFMSLAYPWVSSMFAFYFPVEAFYVGVAVAGLLFLARGRGGGLGARGAAAARDVGLLLFGFSVLWGGLFFAQFLLLWYGNLPEEVSFITERLADGRTRALMPTFIAACWAIPFFGLLPEGAKRRPGVVAAVSVSVLLGILAERLLLVLPGTPVGGAVLTAELALVAGAWILARPRADEPGGADAAAAAGGGK